MDEALESAGPTATAPDPQGAADVAAPSESTTPAAGSAPERGDVDTIAFERLAAGEHPREINRSLREADPPQDAKAREPGKDQSQSAAPAASAHAEAAERRAGYEGLSSASYQALVRTQLLPATEDWKSTPPLVRANLVRAAQAKIAESSRRYAAEQQSQQQARQRTTPQGAADPQLLAQLDEELGPQTTQAAGQPAAWESPTAAAQPQRQTKPSPAAGAQQPGTLSDLDELLNPVADFLTDEGVAPIRSAFAKEREARTQLETQLQQAMQQNERVQQQLAREVYGAQERTTFEGFKNDPALKGAPIEDEAWRESVLDLAMNHYLVAENSGKRIDWPKAIGIAARSIYLPDTKQTAQRELLDGRRASLRGSPERGTAARSAAPPPLRPASAKDDDVWARLERGEEPRAIQRSLA